MSITLEQAAALRKADLETLVAVFGNSTDAAGAYDGASIAALANLLGVDGPAFVQETHRIIMETIVNLALKGGTHEADREPNSSTQPVGTVSPVEPGKASAGTPR